MARTRSGAATSWRDEADGRPPIPACRSLTERPCSDARGVTAAAAPTLPADVARLDEADGEGDSERWRASVEGEADGSDEATVPAGTPDCCWWVHPVAATAITATRVGKALRIIGS
ncbi:hypothetical protein FYJ43_00015 [Cutibacterium sp. WCA-380-WT-3A]|uniref:Uncharacterized protein n=1 Tax=Cutibacterium porci TaxID=2605781 RepID=A0A7K0J3I4_9ACTN|nr:hypothetical protein [Cutibacterium porci]